MQRKPRRAFQQLRLSKPNHLPAFGRRDVFRNLAPPPADPAVPARPTIKEMKALVMRAVTAA